jgi:SPP1 gp7 family putative phage head morphogenesis protein
MTPHGVDALLDAHFSLAMMKMNASRVSTREVLRILQDEWGCPLLERVISKRDEEGKRAGDHGIDEIARQEKAFYNAMTDGQKEAYRAVKSIVEQLFAINGSWDGIDPWSIDEPVDEWKRKALQQLATHPMQAYLLGQMLASEKLEQPLHRPLLPTDGQALQFLQHYTFNEVHSAFEALKSNLRTALIEGISNGENPREVARKMANELDDYETQFDVISITETARAESQGRLRELDDAGEEWCIGSSAHDARTCDDCLALIDGKKYKVKDVINNSNFGKKRSDWIPTIPLHPRCRCVWLPTERGS